MARFVDYEIGPGYKPGGIVFVGRDPGNHEVLLGRPFVGPSGDILNECLRRAGIRRQDIAILNTVRYQPEANDFQRHPRERVEREVAHLHETLARLRPNIVVALGNEAAFASLEGRWPSRDGTIFTATGIGERRGYLWHGIHKLKVLTTVHPAAVQREWVPWSVLLAWDIERAKEEARHADIERPRREVEIVETDREAQAAARELRRCDRIACDIENYDERRLACVGFAGSSDRAFVFPAKHIEAARTVLEDRGVKKIFQNGAYDLYFLLTRCGIRVEGFTDDTLLMWHAAYPELAGAGQKATGERKMKRTQKSLRFFASLFTTDEWWKDYDFENDTERFILNGRDCCVTYDVAVNHLEPLVDALGVRGIYEHEIGLVWPCVVMQQRGLRVDDKLRLERIHALDERLRDDTRRLNELVMPLLERERGRLDLRLFEQIEGVCPCCRHAAKKQQRCWSCAGFAKAPSKADFVRLGGDPKLSKEELETQFLDVCRVCGGAPRRRWLEFNPRSVQQTAVVLYDVLKLPKRFEKGKMTTNEDALKGLLAYVQQK